jgi:hypothetical protein
MTEQMVVTAIMAVEMRREQSIRPRITNGKKKLGPLYESTSQWQ